MFMLPLEIRLGLFETWGEYWFNKFCMYKGVSYTMDIRLLRDGE